MVIRRDENGFARPALKVRRKGEVLKFEEVKEFLPPMSDKNVYCPLPNTVEEKFTDVLQLKAKISALISELEEDKKRGTQIGYNFVLERLRELSAVYQTVKCKAWSSEPLVACKQGFKGLCPDKPCILMFASQE